LGQAPAHPTEAMISIMAQRIAHRPYRLRAEAPGVELLEDRSLLSGLTSLLAHPPSSTPIDLVAQPAGRVAPPVVATSGPVTQQTSSPAQSHATIPPTEAANTRTVDTTAAAPDLEAVAAPLVQAAGPVAAPMTAAVGTAAVTGASTVSLVPVLDSAAAPIVAPADPVAAPAVVFNDAGPVVSAADARSSDVAPAATLVGGLGSVPAPVTPASGDVLPAAPPTAVPEIPIVAPTAGVAEAAARAAAQEEAVADQPAAAEEPILAAVGPAQQLATDSAAPLVPSGVGADGTTTKDGPPVRGAADAADSSRGILLPPGSGLNPPLLEASDSPRGPQSPPVVGVEPLSDGGANEADAPTPAADASSPQSRWVDLALAQPVQQGADVDAALAFQLMDSRPGDDGNAWMPGDARASQPVAVGSTEAEAGATRRAAGDSTDAVADAVPDGPAPGQDEEGWDAGPIRGLPVRLLGLLADFPLGLDPLDFAAQAAANETAGLLRRAGPTGWPLWVSLLSAAAAAAEIARREMARTANEPPLPGGDPASA
jgi:hypothetical protein